MRVRLQFTGENLVVIDILQSFRPALLEPCHELLERWPPDDHDPTLELVSSLLLGRFKSRKGLPSRRDGVQSKLAASAEAHIVSDAFRDIAKSFPRYQFIVYRGSDQDWLKSDVSVVVGEKETISLDLDVLPEVLDRLVVILVAGPFAPVDYDATGGI